MAYFQGYGTLFVFDALSIVQRTRYTPKGKISFAITKSVKHGSISLVLLSNMFTADLTVCMDISPNPGPAGQNSSVTELSHHCLHTPASSVDGQSQGNIAKAC